MIGKEISGYRILHKIGEGGMGVVYKALDLALDREVAIKILHPNLALNPELIQRFHKEARTQANVHHPNIATLFAFLQVSGECLIVMEFLEGETFDDLLQREHCLPWKKAVILTKQVLTGLDFAHARGVVHRDIKPGNLMLTSRGAVKIMDFGIAKVRVDSKMTRTGFQMGTLAYMSPEQIQGHVVDARSDIYSVGITLYQLLSGTLPFENDTDYGLMTAHLNTPPPSLTTLQKDIPIAIDQCVLKALAKSSTSRYATANEFLEALELVSTSPLHPIIENCVKTLPVALQQREESRKTLPESDKPYEPEEKSKLKGKLSWIIGSTILIAFLVVFFLRGKENNAKREAQNSSIFRSEARTDNGSSKNSSPNTNEQRPATAPAPQRTIQTSMASVLLRSDTNCVVYVDDEAPRNLRAGELLKVTVDQGQHLLRAKSSVSGFQIEKTILIRGYDQQIVELPIGREENAQEQNRLKIAAQKERKAEGSEDDGDLAFSEAIQLSDSPDGNKYGSLDERCSTAKMSWRYALQNSLDQTRIERLKKKLNSGKGITCNSPGQQRVSCQVNEGNGNVYIYDGGVNRGPLLSCNKPD